MILLWLFGGLAVLLAGARWFVAGVSALARALGVPPLVIGMSVVAFGTSTPELVVNGLSAAKGSTELAFGNVIGSCIVNIGFVLGLTAMAKPLRVEPSLITREIPMLLVSVAAFVVLGNDVYLDGSAANRWTRIDGCILLLFFCIFLYYTTRQALAARPADPFVAEIKAEAAQQVSQPLGIEIAKTVVGLVGVSIGAQWTVDSAVLSARSWGMPEAVIGLTIISLGTTLPELATCIMAARRGEPEIALGNIVGSNIFNLLAIGGLVGTIAPMPLPPGGLWDLGIMALLSAILLPIAIRSERTITREEGSALFLTFAVYLVWRVMHALGGT